MAFVRLFCGVLVALLLTGFLGVGHSSGPDWFAMSFGIQAVNAYPGGSIVLSVGIQNVGMAQEKIVWMNVSVDFAGQLPVPTQLPFILQPNERRDFQFLVEVPASASVGGHLAQASVSYEYLDPATQQWLVSTHSPWVMQMPAALSESPNMKFRDGFAILASIVLTSGAIPVGTSVLSRKRKAPFALVGTALGFVGGAFGLLIFPLTLFGSGQRPLSDDILSITVFIGSILGIIGLSPRPRTWMRGLLMLGGGVSIVLAWWYGFSLSIGTSSDSGAQNFLGSTMYFFWWIALLITGGLMMSIDELRATGACAQTAQPSEPQTVS